MELLGLLALLLLLYLLIAPALAWAIANRASARAQQAEQANQTQGQELRRVAAQLVDLRNQYLLLQVRLKAIEGESAAPAVAPAADLNTATPPSSEPTQARTAPPPQRSVTPEYRFDPVDFEVPAAAEIVQLPEPALPPQPVAEQSPPTLATTPVPAHLHWDLQPVEAVLPQEPTPSAAAMASTRAAWTEQQPPLAAATESADGEPKPQAWKPKPPLSTPQPPRTAPRPPRDMDTPLSLWLSKAKGWLFGGNLVAKIGLMILFIGVAFLLRLASTYVTVPIELRLASIAVGAIALLGWGWHIRLSRPGIALPTQGAALATLMLVTFGAYKIYHLLPSGPTFGLLLLLVAFTCILAVLQDALWLAVFGIVGGFAVPILTSSGDGSHVALFSYYALLNAGILAIAWQRSWRSLNVLGFLFTFIIGTAWGVQRYEPQHYDSAQFFLILFVLFYVAIAVLYAWRQSNQLKLYVDATLVFGVPTVAMALQHGLVKDMPLGSALSALGFGLFYAALGSALWRWRQGHLRLLVECFFALAMVFGTLAIPLAFDGRWTSAAWALEGAGVVWVGLRQRQPLVWRFGLLVQFLSWIAFVRTLTGIDVISALSGHISLGFMLLGATGVFLALLFRAQGAQNADDNESARARFGRYASAFIVIAVVWLLAGMWVEIWLRVDGVHRASLYVLTAIALVFALQWLGRRAGWRVPHLLAGAVTAVAGLTFLGLMAQYMDWRNLAAYPESTFGEMLANSALLGGLLLSGGALVSAFAFKRQARQLESDVLDASGALRASVAWFLLALFWWCGFAVHGAAHALAWLTTAAAAEAAPWYQIAFWPGYGIGLALSAYGAMIVADRYQFPQRDAFMRLLWPTLTAAALWIYLIQVSPSVYIEHLLDFTWARDLPGAGTAVDIGLAWFGGPLLGALILTALCWIGTRRLHNPARYPSLSDAQRSSGLAIWLVGLGIAVHVLLLDGLSQLGSGLLSAAGASSQPPLAWLSYADMGLIMAGLAAVVLMQMTRRLGFAPLRWLALPSAVLQALASLTVLAQLYQRGLLPTLGTGAALTLMWLAMAWCLRQWQRDSSVSDLTLKWLHFGRVIAPWLMLAPLVSLNLMPWLVGDTGSHVDPLERDWVVAGMWPDYMATWAALAALFLGLRQVRSAGWPLKPLHDWYGQVVIPIATFWATLLAVYWNLRQDGSMAPLPYLPILNPLDLTTAFVALLWADLWRMYRHQIDAPRRREIIQTSMVLAFGWLNLMLLRTAAQYLGLPYRFDPLFQSQFVQAMLSLVWTLCAFALMRYAVRKLSKPLWMVGAVLLGFVVIKLFLVDLRNVGSVARIVSFMGVGGLMLLIGYLAPLPRETEDRDHAVD